LLMALMTSANASGGGKGDDTGILRKSIPERLIVLTFDDGCRSHATVVAPVLKRLAFNATFYVVKPGTFSPRRSWYVSYRELRSLAGDGFEIGNHTSRHQSGAEIEAFLDLEDYLLAHGIPKPSTVCWPVYRVNTDTFHSLLENGYGFGRGGHNRPYRPTVDHPLDAPSFTLNGNWTMGKFISVVRQATAGKVVVLCYHGVPDLQHPWVNVDPQVFAEQMQYLKTNGYKVIAMRDLAEYIDIAEASKLPPTVRDYKEPGPIQLVEGDAPYVADATSVGRARPAPQEPKKTVNRMRLNEESVPPGAITVEDDTCLELNRVTASNPLVLHGGVIKDLSGFGSNWSGPVTFNGNTHISVYSAMTFKGPITGPGGFTMVGRAKGKLCLQGPNTYTGETRIVEGLVEVRSPLYGNNLALWTPANITAEEGAELRLHVGGDQTFSADQAEHLLTSITGRVNHNGLLAGAVFALDTSYAKGVVTMDADISDAQGPGGGPFVLKKTGPGALRLSGRNSFTGPVRIEQGTLSVASFNSIAKRRPSSSLGAPKDSDNGQILLGNPSDRGPGTCTLQYTGNDESTDREINLVGGKSTVTLEHAGTGRLQFTGAVVISGYGSDKTLVLTGASGNTAEIVSAIGDPYDRRGVAVLSVTKNGHGTWVLSGQNTYSGPTRVLQGQLTLSGPKSLGEGAELHLSSRGIVSLDFEGHMTIEAIYVDGERQSAGTYSSTNLGKHIRGSGRIKTL